MNLAEKTCTPCRGGVPPLRGRSTRQDAGASHRMAGGGRAPPLEGLYISGLSTALDFVNETGAIAEAEGHHPDLYLSWGKVEVKTWTHKIDGLTESDFILAAKIDGIRH